jgi:peptidyl-prolyl cis-trans isomerase A (cyclophilin A)
MTTTMSTTEIIKESGLRMTLMADGDGPTPIVGQTVLAHYEIYFGEGTTTSNYDYAAGEYIDEMFDSTYEEKPFNGPVEFIIGVETPKDDTYAKGQSIKGFDEAFLDMKVGDKRKLFIPAALAYGDEGASSFHTFFGYRVAPNRDISCTVELVDIIE